jgi:hypothetical protein
MVGYLTNIYCPTVGHLIENLLKKSNAPPMPDSPPPLGLNIDRCISKPSTFLCTSHSRRCYNATLFSDFHKQITQIKQISNLNLPFIQLRKTTVKTFAKPHFRLRSEDHAGFKCYASLLMRINKFRLGGIQTPYTVPSLPPPPRGLH